ncbi:hypothetical protein ACVBEQ_26360 [Nakamurella sp. GG22]
MENAARLADAKGDEQQALRILEGALKRTDGSQPELQDAQAYRDELVERITGTESRPTP